MVVTAAWNPHLNDKKMLKAMKDGGAQDLTLFNTFRIHFKPNFH